MKLTEKTLMKFARGVIGYTKENGYIFLQTHKNKNRIYSSNTNCTRWDFPSPYPMKLRIVRFMLDTGQYETLATSLPRSFTLQEKLLWKSRRKISMRTRLTGTWRFIYVRNFIGKKTGTENS